MNQEKIAQINEERIKNYLINLKEIEMNEMQEKKTNDLLNQKYNFLSHISIIFKTISIILR